MANERDLTRFVSLSFHWCHCSEAIKLALKRSGLTLAQMDIIDVNEAFAAQFLAVQRELDLPMEKTVRNLALPPRPHSPLLPKLTVYVHVCM